MRSRALCRQADGSAFILVINDFIYCGGKILLINQIIWVGGNGFPKTFHLLTGYWQGVAAVENVSSCNQSPQTATVSESYDHLFLFMLEFPCLMFHTGRLMETKLSHLKRQSDSRLTLGRNCPSASGFFILFMLKSCQGGETKGLRFLVIIRPTVFSSKVQQD